MTCAVASNAVRFFVAARIRSPKGSGRNFSQNRINSSIVEDQTLSIIEENKMKLSLHEFYSQR